MYPVVYKLDKTNTQDNLMLLKHLIQLSLVVIKQLQSKHEENRENYQMLLVNMYNHHRMIHMHNLIQHNIVHPKQNFFFLFNIYINILEKKYIIRCVFIDIQLDVQ